VVFPREPIPLINPKLKPLFAKIISTAIVIASAVKKTSAISASFSLQKSSLNIGGFSRGCSEFVGYNYTIRNTDIK